MCFLYIPPRTSIYASWYWYIYIISSYLSWINHHNPHHNSNHIICFEKEEIMICVFYILVKRDIVSEDNTHCLVTSRKWLKHASLSPVITSGFDKSYLTLWNYPYGKISDPSLKQQSQMSTFISTFHKVEPFYLYL